MADAGEVQLKRGVLELCVLAFLSRGDNYAYEIATYLAQEIDMGEGTIYPLMRRMQGDGPARGLPGRTRLGAAATLLPPDARGPRASRRAARDVGTLLPVDRSRTEGRPMTRAGIHRASCAGASRDFRRNPPSGIVADYESYFDDGRQRGSDPKSRSGARARRSGAAGRRTAPRSRRGLAGRTRRARAARHFARSQGCSALLALDGLLLLPLALVALLVAAGFVIAALAILYGAFTLTYGLFDEPAGGVLAAVPVWASGVSSGGIAGIAVLCYCSPAGSPTGCARYVRTPSPLCFGLGAIRPIRLQGVSSHESN